MNDGYQWWLLIVGLVLGVALAWLLIARLRRDEEDVSAVERRAEAAWISGTIEAHGGIAPRPLVEEVLELHRIYLATPTLRQGDGEPDAGTS